MNGPAIRWMAMLLMTGAIAPAVPAALAGPETGSVAEARPPQGRWTVVRVERAPWAEGVANQSWRGRAIRFGTTRLSGPKPFACPDAVWTATSLPPDGLFQGNLPEGRAAAEAARLGLADPAPTARLDCASGSFDLHRTARGYVVALDNDLLFLEPVRGKGR